MAKGNGVAEVYLTITTGLQFYPLAFLKSIISRAILRHVGKCLGSLIMLKKKENKILKV